MAGFIAALLFLAAGHFGGGVMAEEGSPPGPREVIEQILQRTEPLAAPRGERMPLLLWPAHDLGTEDEAELLVLMRGMAERGMPAIADWRPGDPAARQRALSLGRLQRQVGMPLCVNATSCLYSFFDGDSATAYVTDDGQRFFDDSFGKGSPMGNPFALDHRIPVIRGRVEELVRAYQEAGLTVDFVFADWEIDGPIEWNGTWAAARRDPRVRRRVGGIDDFATFQKAIRQERSRLQRLTFAEPVRAAFPNAMVGNYAVYPGDGWRYWYDFFEYLPEGAPYRQEGRARYRPWYDEFPLTGYTFAMATVYSWADIYGWYDFEPPEYRWFYNTLKVGSNVGGSTPAGVPIVTFVHWEAIPTWATPQVPGPSLSRERYQELLWHLLLRGHDALFLWATPREAVEETVALYEVYAASHAYREFLVDGQPVVFDVPPQPGPVVSALRLGDRLLVRRTDFTASAGPVAIQVDGKSVDVHPAPGRCQVLTLP